MTCSKPPTRFTALLTFALLSLSIPRNLIADPFESDSSDANWIETTISAAIRDRVAAVRECFLFALAIDRTRHGTIFIRAIVSPSGSVTSADVQHDELKNRDVSDCLIGELSNWDLKKYGWQRQSEESEVVLPITLSPHPEQVAVSLRHAPSERLSSDAIAKKRLLTPRSVGATKTTLEVWEIRSNYELTKGGDRERIIYVVNGSGRYGASPKNRSAPSARQPPFEAIERGDALYLAGDLTIGFHPDRQTPLTLVVFTIPSAPKNRTGEALPSTLVKSTLRTAPRYSMSKGAITVTPLWGGPKPNENAHALSPHFYLGLITAGKSAQIPTHRHVNEAEVLYVLSGRAEMVVEKESTEIEADLAIYIGENRAHSLTATERITALQLYLPGGPEKRFFTGAPIFPKSATSDRSPP